MELDSYACESALLCAVARTSLLAITNTRGVERSADDLVTNTREVLHTTTTNKHDTVLLEVVALTWNVSGDFDAGRKTNTADLAKRRVRLLRSRGVHTSAHATTLRSALQCRRSFLATLRFAALTDQLIDSWHSGNFHLCGPKRPHCLRQGTADLLKPGTQPEVGPADESSEFFALPAKIRRNRDQICDASYSPLRRRLVGRYNTRRQPNGRRNQWHCQNQAWQQRDESKKSIRSAHEKARSQHRGQ